MDIRSRYYFILLMTACFAAAPAYAEQEPACDEALLVKHHGKQMIDEASLQRHMDGLRKQMSMFKHGRGSHLTRNRELRTHLNLMQEAMQELHDQMYLMGCRVQKEDVSLDARVEAMEKQLNFVNQMLEQVIEHLSGADTEPAT